MPKTVRMLKTLATPKMILNEGKLYTLSDALYKQLAPDNHSQNPMFDEEPERAEGEKVYPVRDKPDPGDELAGQPPGKQNKVPKFSVAPPKEEEGEKKTESKGAK
jgi:hypothetical protein